YYSVGGASSTGGSINLPTVSLVTTDHGMGLVARIGAGGGAGGSVTIGSIRTTGSGVVINAEATFSSPAIDASAVGSGNGGAIYLSTQTLVSPGPGPTSMSANGAGTGNGGVISLNFSQTSAAPGAGPISVSANGAGTGNGGSVSISSYSNDSDIKIGSEAGNLSISAMGGSPGSASGNGGSVLIVNYGNVTLDPAAVNVAPRGANGNGGEINLNAFSTQVEHTLSIVKEGVINASGVGNGNGGRSVLVVALDVTAAGPVTLAAIW